MSVVPGPIHSTPYPTAAITGGAFFGGIAGAVASVSNVLFSHATGKDFSETVFAWLGIEDNSAPTRLAQSADNAVIAPRLTQASGAGPGAASFGALAGALGRQDLDPGIAVRALTAYRNTIAVQKTALAPLEIHF